MRESLSSNLGVQILLIEDEEFLRRIFKSRLVAEGYEVTEVGDAEAALEVLATLAPHLIILDLSLPKMNGFQFLQRLRAHPTRSKTPVLILSGLGQEADIRKGLALGAKEYVVKTEVKPRELLDKIHTLLKKSSPRGPNEG